MRAPGLVVCGSIDAKRLGGIRSARVGRCGTLRWGRATLRARVREAREPMSANASNPSEGEESPSQKRGTKGRAPRAREIDRAEACPEPVIEAAVEGLSGCSQDVLSRAVCRGIVDPDDVIAWTERTQKLVRFQYDRAQLRSEVTAIAEGLRELLCQVDLPDGRSPESLTTDFVGSLVNSMFLRSTMESFVDCYVTRLTSMICISQ